MEAVSSLLRKIFTQSSVAQGTRLLQGAHPRNARGLPTAVSVPPVPVSPRQGVPKPPGPGPWRRGSAHRPRREPTRLCVSGPQSHRPNPSRRPTRKPGYSAGGPARSCRVGPPAGLPSPDAPPRAPRFPDLSGVWPRLLPGPRPQELRVRWTAVSWLRSPPGAQSLWTGPVRSHGLVFPGPPRAGRQHGHTIISHCHRAPGVHTAGWTVP